MLSLYSIFQRLSIGFLQKNTWKCCFPSIVK
nr:MAG TPA: hypothetical protein [Caudoviricetes sp.]